MHKEEVNMISYVNSTLCISESDRQDTIKCKCTLEQLKCAIKKIKDNGIKEENVIDTPEPKNNWEDVAEYNEKIGYTSIVVNDKDKLQIAKVSIGCTDVIIVKHIGTNINKQCNFITTQKDFIEELLQIV